MGWRGEEEVREEAIIQNLSFTSYNYPTVWKSQINFMNFNLLQLQLLDFVNITCSHFATGNHFL